MAAFLGDPNFPQILSKAKQGERIRRYQELYKQYSRLGLSKPFDRPTAIDGLQRRLLRTMEVQGGFGVFDGGVTRGLLRRSLLWCRGSDIASLSRIEFPVDRIKVPSWSWMAYTGGIDYLDLDFGNFDWEDIQSPWSDTTYSTTRIDTRPANIALTVTAREYDLGAAKEDEGQLVFDDPKTIEQRKTICVVMGKEKGRLPQEQKKHGVLIIAPIVDMHHSGREVYERVGVGHVPGKCIGAVGREVHIY